MIGQPKILLMDRPFSLGCYFEKAVAGFDRKNCIKRVWDDNDFVTHDTDEALKLGDRIAVLQDGEIRQVANPETI